LKQKQSVGKFGALKIENLAHDRIVRKPEKEAIL